MLVRFEHRTGWRYLQGGSRDRVMRKFAAIAACTGLAGVLMIVAGATGAGSVVLVTSMLATAMFALLSAFTVFTSMSVFGVVLGCAALTVVLSVTTGFQHAFRDKVLGVNAHVIARNQTGYFPDYGDVMETARDIDPDVIAVEPFLFEEVVVTTGKGAGAGVAIKGIDPKLGREVLDLEKYVEEGSLDALAEPHRDGVLPPLVIGRGLAEKLGAKLGGTITVVIPFSNMDFETRKMSSTPRTRRFRVAGIFYSGFEEYDRRLMFASLAETQALAGRGDVAMGVELKIADVDRAGEIAEKLEAKLGLPWDVIGWRALNQGLFKALVVQKVVLVVILTLIILVAAVNMVSALAMLVTEKTREIAILKSMGSTSTGVARVFRTVGLTIGLIGTGIGIAVGLVTCHLIGEYGFRLDPKVYMIDKLPIEIQPFEVVMVAAIAIAISWIASAVPARAAASLPPVEGLRYD
jgi:lipoprotein-releasing system permease protein